MIENDISICRICLLDGKTGDSLYNDENSTSYGAMIKDFIGFDLTQNDNLSSLICDSCISELTIVVEFITKVKTSYERFKYFNNFDDSWEKNDSYLINGVETLPISFISAGVFTSIKDEQESKMIGDIKQENADVHDGGLSVDNLIPCESNGVFCPNADEEDSPKEEKLVEDTIANRRLLKTPLVIEQYIENHSRSEDISRGRSVVSKTDGLHTKQPIFTVVTSKEHGFKKDKLKCLVCGVVVLSKSASIVHMRKHTGERPYHCTCCKKNFMQISSFNTHMKTLHPEEWMNMPVSQKDKEIRNIEMVKYKRDDDGCVVCEHCGKSYKRILSLVNHLQTHKKSYKREVEERVTCDYCGKSYTRKGTLITHIRIHTNEKPFVCSYCPRTFRLPTSFRNHVRARHTMERPYCCHVCGKSFPAAKNLRKHLTSHITEKKFQCNMCEVFVKTKRCLTLHIECVHSTKKKICHICGTAFSLTYNLNQHIKRRHSGQQKLESTSIGLTDAGHSTGNIVVQCKVCEKPFSNLEKHMKQHTDEQPFDCDFCHKRFFQRKHLLQHVKKHQNKEVE